LFSGLFDHTDLHFNLGDGELPDGMESTDELMARDGVWVTAADAVATLEGLLAVVNSEKPRFGLVRDDYEVVVSELSESIEYAKKAAELGAKFNFSVVM
ncbi:MAG: hypothetical protein KDD11_23670, partial [Acidobacteria bacterium]|nr:hypothetical protein [Acidobacteriota bacterium]